MKLTEKDVELLFLWFLILCLGRKFSLDKVFFVSTFCGCVVLSCNFHQIPPKDGMASFQPALVFGIFFYIRYRGCLRNPTVIGL